MPTLDQHQSAKCIKLLLIGDSGSGKTGALASLINSGRYEFFIQDYDNGLDALTRYVKPEFLKLVNFETLTDKLKYMSGVAVPDGAPDAFVRGTRLLSDGWPGKGSIFTWGPDKVLVIDSLTFLGNAILRLVRTMAGNLAGNTTQPQWGEAMKKQEELLQMLFAEQIKCNVIVIAHITFEKTEGEAVLKGYPSGLGAKLPPKIPSYFNSVLMCKTEGSGASVKKKILTKSTAIIELKNPNPVIVPQEFGIEDGLLKFFDLILGTTPTKAA